MREIPYSVFQQRIGVNPGQRIPVEGTVETTYRCNLNCAHCYVNEPAGDREIQGRELSLERLKVLVDEIADAGTLHVLFTGGEVLVRPDFPELYLHALRRGLLVTIFTNGTMITERLAELFDEYRPQAIEITLYGMTRETYEKVTRVPGSYDKCIEGVQRLVARKITLKLKTMLLTWNQHEAAAMEAYARGLGLEFKFDGLLNPRVDCGSNRRGELQMAPEQVVALELDTPEKVAELKEFCANFVAPADEPVSHDKVYTCGAGERTFTVDPYGRLQMCQLSRRSFFDLKQGSFDEGWNEFFPMLRARTWQKNDVCKHCNLMSLCGSCPGAAEMEHGDIEAMVENFCEIAHLRAHTILGESSGHRRDATCCLGRGRLAELPPEQAATRLGGECGGSCGAHTHDAAPPLIQISRPRPRN